MTIIQTLTTLAKTVDKQIEYLYKLGTSPSTDELALEFSDTYEIFKGELREGINSIYINDKILNNLEIINQLFEKMSNISNNSFWNTSSLDNTEWQNIRKVAKETLELINV
jgi:hypothetical protein